LEKLNIALLLGTKRKGANSEAVALLAKQLGEQREDIDLVYVDPKDLNLPDEGEDTKDHVYSKVTAEADGFFIVTPEYNHSFPGSLKSGPFGGVRAIKALLPVVQRLGMVPCFVEVPHPKANDLVNEDGSITDQATIDRINAAYDELIWFAKTLKAGQQ